MSGLDSTVIGRNPEGKPRLSEDSSEPTFTSHLRLGEKPPVHERRRLCDIVASRIRDYIIENQLKVGDRLPTELDLAKQFGVSRVSIREATKSLCFMGFLEATPRRGTTVGRLDFGRILQFLEFHPALKDASARQLVQTRLILEAGVLPIVSERFQQSPILAEGLLQLLDSFSPAMSIGEWLELDAEFHGRLLDASGLTPLFLFRELLTYFRGRLSESVQRLGLDDRLRGEMSARADELRRIVSLLREGRVDQAKEELTRNINSYMPVLESVTAPAN